MSVNVGKIKSVPTVIKDGVTSLGKKTRETVEQGVDRITKSDIFVSSKRKLAPHKDLIIGSGICLAVAAILLKGVSAVVQKAKEIKED